VIRATARLCGSLKRDPHASTGAPVIIHEMSA
jgi:hypothetical protein